MYVRIAVPVIMTAPQCCVQQKKSEKYREIYKKLLTAINKMI